MLTGQVIVMADIPHASGNIFLITGGPISWYSKKQAIVALLTSEAEYVALSTATHGAFGSDNH